ncbi:MAG: phosphate acyltransferase PlsX [Candidatus Kapaibacterium sp.]|nr:MAG: phosphate acyltransferase PlsX [Candidatus Kapabacteria bacterium]
MPNVSSQPTRIVLDAMGGDFAPHNEILGAKDAMQYFRENGINAEVILIGNEPEIRAALAKHGAENLNFTVLHADEVVTMEDEPAVAFRKKRNSSLYLGLQHHKEGKAEAFVSAGNTGAVMSHSTLILGRIQGVSRPTIGTFLPTTEAYPTLLVDAGANVDCKPKHLYEFGVMGSIYVRRILGVENPRVGLLNVGEEEIKGNEAALEAHTLLKESSLNFAGNIEGRDILMGAVHVVVCDGFVGNIVLKFAESMLTFLKAKFTAFAEKSFGQKLMMGAAKPALKGALTGMNYEEYGGVPLLGVNGVSIIGHGKSTPLALKNMILRAEEVVRKEVNRSIETALNS